MSEYSYIIANIGGWNRNSTVKNYLVYASTEKEAIALGRKAFREEHGIDPRESWVSKSQDVDPIGERP